MKKIRIIHFIALLLFPMIFGFSDCNIKDNLVVVTYQHLADCKSWYFRGDPNTGTSDHSGFGNGQAIWRVYMVRGIMNKGKDAVPFDFDIKKLKTESGASVDTDNNAMIWFADHTLPLDFKAAIEKGQTFAVSNGQSALFFIKQNIKPEADYSDNLRYDNGASEVKVLTAMLEPGASPVLLEQLTAETIGQLKAKQKEFENNYDPEGKKLN